MEVGLHATQRLVAANACGRRDAAGFQQQPEQGLAALLLPLMFLLDEAKSSGSRPCVGSVAVACMRHVLLYGLALYAWLWTEDEDRGSRVAQAQPANTRHGEAPGCVAWRRLCTAQQPVHVHQAACGPRGTLWNTLVQRAAPRHRNSVRSSRPRPCAGGSMRQMHLLHMHHAWARPHA